MAEKTYIVISGDFFSNILINKFTFYFYVRRKFHQNKSG